MPWNMKSRVKLSRYSLILTIVINIVLVGGCFLTIREPAFPWLLAVTLALLFLGMYFGPISISVDDKYIKIHSMLKTRRIPLSDVVSVEPFKPTMGAYRLCGAGGYMGYWGLFREGDVGRYMAYYGNASDCFLVRMGNGDKYVLGCENPSAIISAIASRIR